MTQQTTGPRAYANRTGWVPTLPNAKLWVLEPKNPSFSSDPRTHFYFVEAERFIDVRDLGARIYGTEAFQVRPWNMFVVEEPGRYQIQWVGSAAGLNDLRKQWRFVQPGKRDPRWKEMMDFAPPSEKTG